MSGAASGDVEGEKEVNEEDEADEENDESEHTDEGDEHADSISDTASTHDSDTDHEGTQPPPTHSGITVGSCSARFNNTGFNSGTTAPATGNEIARRTGNTAGRRLDAAGGVMGSATACTLEGTMVGSGNAAGTTTGGRDSPWALGGVRGLFFHADFCHLACTNPSMASVFTASTGALRAGSSSIASTVASTRVSTTATGAGRV